MSDADDAKAKELVLKVLGDPVVPRIKVTIGQWSIKGSFYADVAQAIKDGKITVMVDKVSANNDVAAAYLPVLPAGNGKEMYDVLVLRITDLGSTANESLQNAGTIIHECTHAGIDLASWTSMTHLNHEVIAYVAAARAQWLKIESMGGKPQNVTWSTTIHQAAWLCARDIADDGEVGMVAITVLSCAIGVNPRYGKTAWDPLVNDGVGKPWKL